MHDAGAGGPDDWDLMQLQVRRRLEAEEDERLAALDALRRRDLADVAASLWTRRTVVELGIGSQRFRGPVAAFGRDWVALANASGEVDARLDGAVWLREVSHQTRSPDPQPAQLHGGGGAATARTFSARLAQLELAGGLVDVGLATPGPELTGRIVAAARDHVLFRDIDGGTWHLAGVAWVRLRGL